MISAGCFGLGQIRNSYWKELCNEKLFAAIGPAVVLLADAKSLRQICRGFPAASG